MRGMAHLFWRALIRHNVHTAGRMAGAAKRHPDGNFLSRLQTIIGRILMPGGDRRRVRLFDEERACIDENVGSKQVLDGIEDARIGCQLCYPGQGDMRHRPPFQLLRRIDRRP